MPILSISPLLSLHYLDDNPSANPVVLLLHGLGATGESWQLQIPLLIQSGFRVLTPDVRGFGKSSYPGGECTIARMAADIAGLLERLRTGPVHTVGISMGGTIAQQLALDHAHLVSKLVLVNTFASLRPDRLRVWLYFTLRFVLVHTLGLPAQARAVSRRIFPRPEQNQLREVLYEQVIQASPSGYRAAMRALARFNVTRRLGEIQAPTLVITGENDTTVSPKNQQLLVKAIPHARQVVVPNAGHAVIAEQPEIFNQILIDFLTSSEDNSPI